MSETIVITRYPNRRLYDRSQKKYVNLGEVEELILNGADIQVQDSRSGKDLTRMILTQIILERHPERMDLFPVQMLHAILRADRVALDWLRAYFAFAQAMNPTDHPAGEATNPFGPGMEMWRAFMPGGADLPPDAPATSEKDADD